MNLIFLGAPGAGKGTQASKVCKKYDIPHISTGEILRANIKTGTELGKLAKKYIDQGLLVPDEVVIDIVKDRLSKQDCQKGYVLDGFPRTLAQAISLDDFANIQLAINIVVNDQLVVERIAGRRMCTCGETYHIDLHPSNICNKCGDKLIQRDDDKEETVKARLAVYHSQSEPLLKYYAQKNNLRNVDGTQGLENLFNAIVRIIDDNN